MTVVNDSKRLRRLKELEVHIGVLANVIANFPEQDLVDLLDTMKHADELQPYVDPTGWMRDGKKRQVAIEVVEALLTARGTLQKTLQESRR